MSLGGKEGHLPFAAHELVGAVARRLHIEAEVGAALDHRHGTVLTVELEYEGTVAVELEKLVRLRPGEVQLAAGRCGGARAVAGVIAAVEALGGIGPAIEHAALKPLRHRP